MQYVVRSPDNMMAVLDGMIDGKRFKSRNQLINVILADWLAREKHPRNPYSKAMDEAAPDYNAINLLRNETRRELLGEEWDKYKHSNALVFEEDETGEVNRQVRELERKLATMEERLSSLEAKMQDDISGPATQHEEPKNESPRPTGQRKTTQPQKGRKTDRG